MTFTDTFEVIRSDLDDVRDLRCGFDTNSCLSFLARVHAVMVREYGGEPLPADLLRRLDDSA